MIAYLFHPEANAEFEDAALFYESRMTGLGKSFADEVQRTVTLIRRFPDTGALVASSRKRVLVARFPYSILHCLSARRGHDCHSCGFSSAAQTGLLAAAEMTTTVNSCPNSRFEEGLSPSVLSNIRKNLRKSSMAKLEHTIAGKENSGRTVSLPWLLISKPECAYAVAITYSAL